MDSYLFNSYVSGTSQVQIATLQELEEIFRAQKKELARRTQGLDPEIPLPSTLRRKGPRDTYYRNTCKIAHKYTSPCPKLL